MIKDPIIEQPEPVLHLAFLACQDNNGYPNNGDQHQDN